MKIEFHLLDLKYENIKGRSQKIENRLLSSLIEQEQLSPIIVLPGDGDPPCYIVVDGFKRIRALKRAGHDTVKVVIWPEDEVNALIAMNHLQRSVDRNALDDAYLIKALRDFHELSYQDIGWRLGRSKSWVGRRLGLITDLPQWLQDQIRDGVLQCSAAEKCILPLSRSNGEDAKVLVKKIRALRLSTRDIGELYCAWRDGDGKGRDLVINQPEIVLRAQRLAKDEAKRADLKSGLLKNMEVILSLSHRIHRSWDQFLISDMNMPDFKQILQTGQLIRSSIEELDKKITSEALSYERR